MQVKFLTYMFIIYFFTALSRCTDHAVVENYIFGFVIGNNTFFENICQVEPGSIFRITQNNDNKILISKSKIECNFFDSKRSSFPDALNELKYLLQESVKSQTIGNYEIGSLLSGGLDSSILTVLLKNSLKNNIQTFSITDNPASSDIEYARNLSAHLKLSHNEIILNPREVLNRFPFCIFYNELPTRLNINFLSCDIIRQKVKGVISGDGADELFGGYSLFDDPVGVLNKYQFNYTNLKRLNIIHDRHFHTSKTKLSNLFNLSQKHSSLESVFNLFCNDQLFNWQFHIADRSSMCHGLEIRLPFLSNNIQDFVKNLYINMKSGKERKPLLKALLKDILPNHIGVSIASRRKMAAPSSSLLCNKYVSDFADMNIPVSYKAEHPLRSMYKSSTSLLSFDLFAFIFIINRGDLPSNFSITNLYTSYSHLLKENINELLVN